MTYKYNFKQIWRYQRHQSLTLQIGGGGEARHRVMLHIGAGHSNNCQIILKLFGYDIFCNNLQQNISRKFLGVRDINHLCYK